jgi:hypothetical protein
MTVCLPLPEPNHQPCTYTREGGGSMLGKEGEALAICGQTP